MKLSISPKTRKWIRIFHRDIGYVMVGVCLIYGISGFLLNRIEKKDPSYKVEHRTEEFAQGLSLEEFKQVWQTDSNRPTLNNIGKSGERYSLLIQGGIGEYNPLTGTASYETHKKRPFAYWVNRLHYNRVGGWSIMADISAISLIFLAISGLFMVRGKKGLAGSGKWYLIIGLIIPIIFILLGG